MERPVYIMSVVYVDKACKVAEHGAVVVYVHTSDPSDPPLVIVYIHVPDS